MHSHIKIKPLLHFHCKAHVELLLLSKISTSCLDKLTSFLGLSSPSYEKLQSLPGFKHVYKKKSFSSFQPIAACIGAICLSVFANVLPFRCLGKKELTMHTNPFSLSVEKLPPSKT